MVRKTGSQNKHRSKSKQRSKSSSQKRTKRRVSNKRKKLNKPLKKTRKKKRSKRVMKGGRINLCSKPECEEFLQVTGFEFKDFHDRSSENRGFEYNITFSEKCRIHDEHLYIPFIQVPTRSSEERDHNVNNKKAIHIETLRYFINNFVATQAQSHYRSSIIINDEIINFIKTKTVKVNKKQPTRTIKSKVFIQNRASSNVIRLFFAKLVNDSSTQSIFKNVVSEDTIDLRGWEDIMIGRIN
mgnify:CR=1 FL=1